MKNFILITFFLVITASSFGKTYYTYTAVTSGNWDVNTTWSTVVRTDNVMKDKFIIPNSFTVTANDNVNNLGYNDVELQISGTLLLASPVTLSFGSGSRIEVFSTGRIDGNGASQTIGIGSVIKYEGNKNKVLGGPVYADATTGTAPNGFSAFSSLAVHFINFHVSVSNDNSVLLNWTTANEINNSRFEIQQRINDGQWVTVTALPAVKVNQAVNQYSYIHKGVSGSLIAYRLKQIDLDGKYEYSTVALIKRNQPGEAVKVYAADNKVTVQLSSEIKTNLLVRVINMEGRTILTQAFDHPSGKLNVGVANLVKGSYVVAVSDNDQVKVITKVMIF